MKLPQMLCFKMSAQDASSPKKVRKDSTDSKTVRKDSTDSTASTTASERHAPKVAEHNTMDQSPRVRVPEIREEPSKALQARIPDIRKEQDWFNHWDTHGLGMLSKPEATTAIQKTFGTFNAEKLSCIIDALWPEFDVEEHGFIGPDGMLKKKSGLVDATLRTYQLSRTVEWARRYSV
jgi:hypothetical protein